jgi:hypothetical protein
MRRAVRGPLSVALVACAAFAVLVTWATRVDGDSAARPAADTRPDAAAVPRPVPPAFVPPAPESLSGVGHLAFWSPVKRATHVRARAGRSAAVIGRLSTRTPEGTRNLVLVLDRLRDARGALWVRARLPILENDATGWVPRSALGGYGTVSTHLVVDVAKLTATLYRQGKQVFEARVGVGRPENPTPTGELYIRN